MSYMLYGECPPPEDREGMGWPFWLLVTIAVPLFLFCVYQTGYNSGFHDGLPSKNSDLHRTVTTAIHAGSYYEHFDDWDYIPIFNNYWKMKRERQ